MILPASKRLVGFYLLSGMIHGLIIWLVVVPLWEKREELPLEVRFQIEDPPKPPPIKKPQPPVKKFVPPPKKPLVKQEKPVPPPVKEPPPPRPQEEILSSPMGIPDFQVPKAPPTVTTPSPKEVERPPLPKGPPPVSKEDLDLTKVPPAQWREQHGIIVYYEADVYILFAGNDKTGIPVPGTDLCIDGIFLRTVERYKFEHTAVTDPEQCWVKDRTDIEVTICPPTAEATTVYFNDYLRTPIEYGVKHCLAYDDSNCRIDYSDEVEREICKVDFSYEGIWGADTKFHYRCTKSETKTFKNPLEYTIRYIEVSESGTGDGRENQIRQFHRVVRSIPYCKK